MARDRTDLHAARYRRHDSAGDKDGLVVVLDPGPHARVVPLGADGRSDSDHFYYRCFALGSDGRGRVLRRGRSVYCDAAFVLVRRPSWAGANDRLLSHHRAGRGGLTVFTRDTFSLPTMAQRRTDPFHASKRRVRRYRGGFAAGFVGPSLRQGGDAKSYRNPLTALETYPNCR